MWFNFLDANIIPNIPDIAIEITPMRGHFPYHASILRIIDMYQNAPLPGPDCLNCPGPVNLHVYIDKPMPFHVERLPYDQGRGPYRR